MIIFPSKISLDKPLKRNAPLTELRHRFDKTDDDLLHNTLKDSLNSIDIDITTQEELKELAVTLCDKLMNAVDTSTPKTYSHNDSKSPISQAHHKQAEKEIRTKLNQESTISWEKFCNSISLESDLKNHA